MSWITKIIASTKLRQKRLGSIDRALVTSICYLEKHDWSKLRRLYGFFEFVNIRTYSCRIFVSSNVLKSNLWLYEMLFLLLEKVRNDLRFATTAKQVLCRIFGKAGWREIHGAFQLSRFEMDYNVPPCASAAVATRRN